MLHVPIIQVASSSNVQILQKGKTVRLLKAAVSDAGRYTCKAINIAGSTERDFYLNVLGKQQNCGFMFLLKSRRYQHDPFPSLMQISDLIVEH